MTSVSRSVGLLCLSRWVPVPWPRPTRWYAPGLKACPQGLPPLAHLANNNGHGFFEALGDGVVTGPTPTNVNAFRAVLFQAAA